MINGTEEWWWGTETVMVTRTGTRDGGEYWGRECRGGIKDRRLRLSHRWGRGVGVWGSMTTSDPLTVTTEGGVCGGDGDRWPRLTHPRQHFSQNLWLHSVITDVSTSQRQIGQYICSSVFVTPSDFARHTGQVDILF